MSIPVWLQYLSAFGTVAAGLALLLAFVQLAGLRRDRLREQVDKVGVWQEPPKEVKTPGEVWGLPVRIRNGSELPVSVDSVVLYVRPEGDNLVRVPVEGKSGQEETRHQKVRGESHRRNVRPGDIAPGRTWADDLPYHQPQLAEHPRPPVVTIDRVVVIDAAGRRWAIRPGRTGPAQLVRGRGSAARPAGD